MTWTAVGVDVGGTKIRAARVSGGRVEAAAVRPTPRNDPTMVLGAITAAVDEVHREGLPIGVATAGQVDRATGVVLTSPNLPGRNVPLGPSLEEAFAAPVLVDNDVRLAAVGEWLALDGRPGILVALYVGTGIGAGVVLGGAPLSGANNLATEETEVMPSEPVLILEADPTSLLANGLDTSILKQLQHIPISAAKIYNKPWLCVTEKLF